MSDVKPPRKYKARSRSNASKAPRSGAKQEADFAILGGPTEDGQGAHLLRFREGTISAGEIRPVQEGESVTHRELVRLHPVDEEKRVCRVETLHAPALPAEPRSRPARVSNERYRKNWDAIFGSDGDERGRDWSVN